MKVTYSDIVKQAGKDYGLIQKATEHLAGIVDPASEELAPFFSPADNLISAEWDAVQDDQGRTRYTLKLSGLSSVVSASFQPSELSQDDNMRWRLRRLWGDLLAANSKAGIKKLGQLVSKLN